jgi:outer membrane protein assembly factor BamB
MPCTRSLAALLLLAAVAPAPAADWPQWLGPSRDGSSTEKIAPWKGAPKIVWRKTVGEGHSSPVVAGGKVFLFTKVKDKDEEELAAYDAKTGEELWKVAYARGSFVAPFGVGPRASPTVHDGKVYTYGVTGFLICRNASDGKEIWRSETLKDFKASVLFFGMSGSPLIDGDKVLINVGGKDGSIVAFKKDTGAVAWKALTDPASYSSPIVFGEGKERQAVFLTGTELVSLSPEDGSVFWKFPFQDRSNESSTTPVRVGDGSLLYAASVTLGSVGLKLKTTDGKPDVEQAWKNPDLTCYFSTPVPVGKDYVYVVSGQFGGLNASSTLHCVEAKSGKVQWKKEKVGKFHAALLRTGDDKLLMLDDFGRLTLLEPDPKGYKELAQSRVCGSTWAHPALSDGKVYLRDDKELLCIQVGE